MSDIVERLQLASKYSSILRQSEHIVSEAADEIERLRELVRDAWKCATDDVGSPFWEQTEKRVREALGE